MGAAVLHRDLEFVRRPVRVKADARHRDHWASIQDDRPSALQSRKRRCDYGHYRSSASCIVL
jgi:hypothetical protein